MWRYIWLCPVYLLVTILPLFAETGRNFEYEYVLLCSYYGLFFIPLAALLTPSELIPFKDNEYRPFIPFDLLWIFIISPIIAILPGAFGFVTTLCQCSGAGFLFWLVLQLYPSWILAHAFYHGILRLRSLGKSRIRIVSAWILTYALLLFFLTLALWFQPQKRALDLLAGFLHGPIYDNWIPVDGGIALARTAHLFAAALILSVAWFYNKRRYIIATSSLAVVWLVIAIFAGLNPSVRSGKERLNKLMPETLKDEHFTLHYTPKTMPGGESASAHVPASIKRLFNDAKFHIADLKKNYFGDHVPFVDIYVYPDRTRKKLWFGGGATDITDTHGPTIHITGSSLPHPTLRHELVHALASGFGYHGLGLHPNMAFTEGLAVALAPEEQEISLDDGAAALITENRLPKLSNLFSPFFWKESGARAYTVAGSIINFLIKNYGFDKVKQLYQGKDWNEIFSESRGSILQKWRDSVLKGYDASKTELYAEAMFRYPGVLGDLCPHSKADFTHSRDDGPFLRLRQPPSWDPQKDYWPWRVKIDPNDRYAKFALWNAEILKFAKDRVIPEGRFITWRQAIRNAKFWPPKTLEDIDLAILESDLARIAQGKKSSLPILQDLDKLAKTKRLGDGLTREIQARLYIEETLQDPTALAWRKYLAGWRDGIPENTETHETWILTYLRLRKGDKQILNKDFLASLINIKPDPKLALTFTVEWYKFIGHRLMQLGAYSSAEAAYQAALDAALTADKPILEEHVRRAKFYQELKD